MPVLLAVVLVVAAAVAQSPAWPSNLLTNPDAGNGGIGWSWLFGGGAAIEGSGAQPHFAVRNPGRFLQTVPLPPEASGQFLVLMARAASGRVNSGTLIAGYPYLSGVFMAADRGRILAYLQAPTMRLLPTAPEAWGQVHGIFPVPDGAAYLGVTLGQASVANVPQDGSAARFDDVGAYLLPTRDHAVALVQALRTDPRTWPSVAIAPPADERSVMPFDPERGTILSESEALRGIRQCSRRVPGPVQGLWTPDAATVRKLELVLAPVLQGALERNAQAARAPFTPADYYRRYSGLIINGRRVLYVNGFRAPRVERADWRTRVAYTCDGGTSFFGAELDVETGAVTSLNFNSGRGN